MFYPEKGRELQAQEAISICGRCVHKAECAEWAIHNEAFGIWGGLSEMSRRWIRQKRKIKIREDFVA